MLTKALKEKAGVRVNKKYHTFYRLVDKEYIATSLPQKKVLALFQEKELVSREEILKKYAVSFPGFRKRGRRIEIREYEFT